MVQIQQRPTEIQMFLFIFDFQKFLYVKCLKSFSFFLSFHYHCSYFKMCIFYLFIYYSVYQFSWYTVGSLQHFAAFLINLLYQIKCACMYVCMYARMHTTATACGTLPHAHLAIPLACKIRLALLVVNSVKLHLTACKCNLSPKKYSNCFLFTSPLSTVWMAL